MMLQDKKYRRYITSLSRQKTSNRLYGGSDSTGNSSDIFHMQISSASSSNNHNDVSWVNGLGSSSSESLGVNPMLTLNGDNAIGNHNDIITISSDSDNDDPTIDTSLNPATYPTRNLLNYSSTIPLNGGKQLLFLYDCETTGLSHYVEHIIEIASVVIVPDDANITQTEFSSLCYTSRHISPLTTYITGIANEMLIGKPPFSTVFKDLLEWIKQCTLEASGSNNLYRPVLVAHNGFAFDYLFLMAEVERHQLKKSLDRAELWFADTLYDARRLVRTGHPIFNIWSKEENKHLGLDSLFCRCFPGRSYKGHRAMQDVKCMKQIFTRTMLKPILTNLTVRGKDEIWMSSWKRWNDRRLSKPYIDRMGKTCSIKQAVRLHAKGITYSDLRAAYIIFTSEKFDKWLKDNGIWLKKWRENIKRHFSYSLLEQLHRASFVLRQWYFQVAKPKVDAIVLQQKNEFVAGLVAILVFIVIFVYLCS